MEREQGRSNAEEQGRGCNVRPVSIPCTRIPLTRNPPPPPPPGSLQLLANAEELLTQGVHASDIITGFVKATKFALDTLPTLATRQCEDIRDKDQLAAAIKATLAAKHYGFEDQLADLVATACQMTIPAAGPGGRAPSINVDNVRVAKMQGGSIENSTVIKGMVIMRDAEGTVKHVTDAKVAVFGCSVEAAGTEAKGTVLIEDAGEMVNYNKSEESMMDDNIRAIAESGATVIVSGGSISEMAMHFIEKYNLLAIKILSKFELRRICRATGATAVMRLGTVMEEEMGHADDVAVKEMGGRKNIVIRQDNPDMGIISTIILRSSTKNLLEDLERAADDGVNAARALCRDPRLLPGAGASDMEMSNLIAKYGESLPGLDQYAVAQFARAMQVVPHTLSINAGQDADEMMARLQAAHEEGKSNEGVNIEEVDATLDAGEAAIFDILAIKLEALRLACNAAITVLRVDQIIMSKQAGGPKAPQ